jgi:hypothetical protein
LLRRGIPRRKKMTKRIIRLAALKRVMYFAYLLPGINTRVRLILDPFLRSTRPFLLGLCQQSPQMVE